MTKQDILEQVTAVLDGYELDPALYFFCIAAPGESRVVSCACDSKYNENIILDAMQSVAAEARTKMSQAIANVSQEDATTYFASHGDIDPTTQRPN